MAEREWKIVAFSDTHSMHDQIQLDRLPKADLFIHAGDFTLKSKPEELASFRTFIEEVPYSNKIVIAGNHDIIFYPDNYRNPYTAEEADQERLKFKSICHFLDFERVEIDGLVVLGISKGPEFFDWKFSYAKKEGEAMIEQHKGKVDVLVTHWPPYGILDAINKKEKGGSKGLLEFVMAIRPKVHIFGHIHEQRGQCKQFGIEFYNVSSTTSHYDLIEEPTEITLEKPNPNPKQPPPQSIQPSPHEPPSTSDPLRPDID